MTINGLCGSSVAGSWLLLNLAYALHAGAAGCWPAPTGLVRWWPGDGSAADITGTNSGVLQGGATASGAGVVGSAFTFDGTDGFVLIPDSASSRPTNLTIEGWVRIASQDSAGSGGSPAGDQYIVFKQNSRTSDFEGFDLSKTRAGGSNVFRFVVSSAAGQTVSIRSSTVINTGMWYHVAAVRGPDFVQLYVNGALERQTNVSFAQDYGSHPLYFGTSGQSYWDHKLAGSLDEVSLYDRALEPGEITAIYAAGAAGKCKEPNITTQPESQTVMVGSNATFSVAATGFGTLSYQWRFNSSLIAGATLTSLTLTNIQYPAEGSYSVVVSNALGSVASVEAMLSVLPPPCATAPAGLVGWWRAEGDGSDFASGNTAVLLNGVGYTNARVGQAFDFNGIDGRVTVADAPVLDVGTNDFSIETWIRPLPSTTDFGIMTIVCKRLAPDIIHSLGYEFALVYGQLHLRLSTSLAGDGQAWGPAGPDLRDGQFHHVAVSLARNSPTGGCFYVDGQAVLTFDPTGQNGSLSTSEPLRIGNHATSWLNAFFKGQIDEVSLYARALAASEVQGIYRAEGSGKCAVPIAPTILVQPTDQVATAGDSVRFEVLAVGAGLLSYQWQVNGTNLAGATANSLVLPDVQFQDAGSYTVLVTNIGGTALSSNAVLTVLPPPPCATAPLGLIGWWPGEDSAADVAGGTTGTLHNGVTFGPGKVGQAFKFNGTNSYVEVPDSPNLRLTNELTIEFWIKRQTLNPITAEYIIEKGGDWLNGPQNYGVAIHLPSYNHSLHFTCSGAWWGAGGIADLNWHHCAVVARSGQPAPEIYIDGVRQTLAYHQGGNVNLYPSMWPLHLGAQVDPVSGWNYYSKSLIDELSLYDRALTEGEIQAIYNAERSGKCPFPPAILAHPASQLVPLELTATFEVQASGTPPLNYQWFFNGAALTDDTRITGAKSKLLFISDIAWADAGTYSVWVTNAAGSVTSSVAVLAVAPLLITVQPSDTTAILGSDVTFNAAVAGATPLFYQWQKDGQDLADGARILGAQSNILAITGAETNDAGAYRLVVTNAYGAVTSEVAALTVLVPPAFVLSPSHQSWIVSSSATLYSLATGTEPLSYQWYRGTTPLVDDGRLSGTASNIFSISNVLTSDAGNYTVVASNAACLATSAVAVVAVVVPPGFTTQPRGWSVPPGLPVTLSAMASGTGPLRYQWRLNGRDVAGATSNILTFAALTPVDFGNYQLVVTNLGGGATSVVAQLTRGPVAIWGYYSIAANVPIWPAPGLSNVIAVAGGNGYSVALRGDGTLCAWGINTAATNIPAGLSGIVGVAGGPYHAVALRSNGTVVAWGSNSAGQTNVPVNLSNVVAVSAGDYHSVALRSDGTLVVWGSTVREGQTNIPPGLTRVTAIDAAGFQTLALRENGTVVGWGGSAPAPVPPYLSGVTAVAAGSTSSGGVQAAGAGSSLALLTNGTVVAWNGFGVATNLPSGLTNLIAVESLQVEARLSAYCLVLRSNGTVLSWGSWTANPTNVPAGLSNAVAIAGGATHALALVNDGRPLIARPPVGGTFCSGAPLALQAKAVGEAPLSFQWFKDGNALPEGTNETLVLPSAQSTDAGSYHLVVTNALGAAQSLAVPLAIVDRAPVFMMQPTNGLAFCGSRFELGASVVGSGPMALTWLQNGLPAASGTDALAYDRTLLAHGGAYELVASNHFGAVTSRVAQVTFSRVASWGNGPNPTNAPFDVGTALGIGSGYFHALAIQANRTVIGWGNTSYGATVPPPALSNVVAVSAGSYFSVALKNDGTVAAWGLGSSGQTNVPANLTNAVAISAGGSHALALRADGTVAAWGTSANGVTNVPAGLSNVVGVAAGHAHSMALRNDGSVVLWGAAGKPPSYTNVVAISAGYNQCLVLQADGTVINWSTTGATIPQPANLSNVVAISAGGGWQGYLHSVALRADGTLVAWGNNNFVGQLMVPQELLSATAISAGGGSTLAYLNDRSPAFTVQPWSRTVASGTNVTLRALTVGQPSMRYQWYANGQPLAGATKNSLDFSNTEPAQSGAYQLVAWNDLAAATSAVATLTITVPPVSLMPLGLAANGFWFSFTSLRAVLYIIEFKDNLPGSTWTELERRFGVGGLEIVTDASASGTARFYRVRALYAPPPSLGTMTWTNGAPSFSFATVPDAVYVIRYKERLEDAAWLELSRQTGTGAPLIITDPDPPGPSRFYRVQVE